MSVFNAESKVAVPSPLSGSVPLGPRPPDTTPTKNITEKTLNTELTAPQPPINYYVKYSFMITYILLLTTATITFIEAMRTDVPTIRHILNLETAISVIAGYFYSVFLEKIQTYEKNNKEIDWSDITKTRYVDWAITTPLMLLILCVVLGLEKNTPVKLHTVLQVFGLNYLMLFIGFLGETDKLNHTIAAFAGFVPFALMFYIIYVTFIKSKLSFTKSFLFYFYVIVWSLYGIVYMLPNNLKNIITNVLDCISKCLVGNGLFIYYSHIITGW
jgi:bacteriorhodopsin